MITTKGFTTEDMGKGEEITINYI